MATNQKLKRALLEKLGVTPQALSNRVARKKRLLPMSTEQAVHLIAFEEGVRIDKYLSADDVNEARQMHAQVTSGASSNSGGGVARSKTKSGSREIRFPQEFKATDPLLPARVINEASAMAAIYPLLYVLENSIRDLTKRVMKYHLGDDWWNSQPENKNIKQMKSTVADRMKTETKNAWHQKRGAHPIDYTDFKQLSAVFRANRSLFEPDIITDWEWFLNFLKELYPSRNVVAHMNPLLAENVSDVKVKFRKWERIIKNSIDKIPD